MGRGPLPDWLRHKKGMKALDTFNDNLCLFRCLAVSRGARCDRSANPARELAASFNQLEKVEDVPKTSLDLHKKIEEHFKIGIQVYEPTEEGDWHLTRRTGPCDEKLNIGIFQEHAFFITYVQKLANVYCCGSCKARFTKVCNLQRHTDTCMSGHTQIICPNERLQVPAFNFEKAFYPRPSQINGNSVDRV